MTREVVEAGAQDCRIVGEASEIASVVNEAECPAGGDRRVEEFEQAVHRRVASGRGCGSEHEENRCLRRRRLRLGKASNFKDGIARGVFGEREVVCAKIGEWTAFAVANEDLKGCGPVGSESLGGGRSLRKDGS